MKNAQKQETSNSDKNPIAHKKIYSRYPMNYVTKNQPRQSKASRKKNQKHSRMTPKMK